MDSELIINEINYNLGIESKSKCGEVFVTKNGHMSCFCLICQRDYDNYLTFSNHVLEDHLGLDYLNKFETKNNMQQVKNINDYMNENYIKIKKESSTAEKNNLYASDLSDCLAEDNINKKDGGDGISVENSVIVASDLNKFKSTEYGNNPEVKKAWISNAVKAKLYSCQTTFHREEKLKNHKESHQLDHIDSKHCFKSQENLSTNENLDNDSNQMYKCTECLLVFNSRKLLNNHEKHHVNKFICEMCLKEFTTKKQYDSHSRKCGKPKKCQHCPRIFQKLINLEKHEERHKKMQVCEYCGKLFQNQKAKYQQHLRSHTGEKPFVCSICTSAFSTRGNLNHHKSTCHSEERPYICTWPNCGKGFKKDRQRVWHERIHTGEKPYQCEQCGQHFAFQHKLSLHKKQKHLDKKDRPHKCDQCEKAFVLPRQLREHKYTHTGEKPHQCDICPARFAKRGGLTEHKKLHSGEKKHVCEICGRAFAQRAGYATHMKSHNFV